MKSGTLITLYVILVGLLAVTVGAAYLPMAAPAKIAIGWLVAAAKAGLIAAYFMELRSHRGLVRIFAGAGVFWLLLLAALTAADYLTRT